MTAEPGGAKRRASDLAIVLVTALTVTSVVAMPVIAADPVESSTTVGDDSPVSDREGETVIGPTLQSRLADAGEEETVRALVILDDQPNVESTRERATSRDAMVRSLEERVRDAQAPLVRSIDRLRSSGEVIAFERHWLLNAVSVEATPGAVRELGEVEGVAVVLADTEVRASAGTPAATGAPNNDSERSSNVTIVERERIDRSAAAPRPLDARETVSLPESYAVSEWPGDLDVEDASAPEPITGPPSEDVPDAASTPFDDDDVAWGIQRVHADAANRAGYDGSNVTVAVIDTGIDSDHPDLDDRVVGWADFVNGFDNPYDDGEHGTHVAGTIAGTGDGGTRTGVAPGADLVGVKVLDGSGRGYLSDTISGMEWAIRNDADVMSISLGGPHDPLFHAAVDRAVDAGVVPVVAAGNIGASRNPFTVDLPDLLAVSDPGHARSAITVGATHWQDRISWYSARGNFTARGEPYNKPDVVAPGSNITSARAGTDEYASFSGTSMAAPHVSGVAALVLQADPTASPEAVGRLLEETAVDIGREDVHGAGRVDARAAIAAAGETPGLDLDVAVNETADGSVVTAVASLTDESGSPVSGENVSLNAVYGPPSTLEAHKANEELYAHSGTATTDENGTVEFTFEAANDSSPTGTYTVEATARDGLVRNASSIGLNDDLTVSVSPRNDSVRHNGDTILFDVEARNADGEPANVTVDAVLEGPTRDRLPSWNRTVTTGDDGEATAAVRLHDDLLAIYRGHDPLDGGPSFGPYDLTTVVRADDGTLRDFDVHRDVVDVEPRWTDLEFAGPETPLTPIDDVETWQGDVTVGERVDATLETTEPNTEYRIVLADFEENASEADGNGTAPNADEDPVARATTVANVTTDDDGTATFEAQVPGTMPGGYYAVVAVPEGRDIADPGPVGSYDVGYVYVRALETNVRIDSREDANNQAFQPGEAVRITVTASNASTGAPTDPRALFFELAGFTDVTAVEETAPGTIEMNARFAERGAPDGVVRVGGTDQNGGRFDNHTDRTAVRPFTVQVEPDAPRYEPGENATLDVRIADSESGEAVANAGVRTVVTGSTVDGDWTVNRTVRTGDDGTASVDVPIPSNAVGIEHLASDAVVHVASIEKGRDRGRTTTGIELDERDGPSISVSQNGSEQVGLFGLNDVAMYEPGDRITFDVEATGVDSGLVERDRFADLVVIKYSKVGDGAYVFDENESEMSLVSLDDGRASYEYRLRDDADPGLVVPMVSTRINGVALADSQLGIVGASPVNVTANRSTVASGDRIAFDVSGDVPPRANVDFVVTRKGSQGQSPVTGVDDASDPDLAPILDERNRTLERTDSLASRVVERLPETVGNRDVLRRALLDALVPAMSQSLAASTTDSAIEVGAERVDRLDGNESDVEKSFVVPETSAPGTYRVIAIVHSDDGSVKERIGFAEFEVEE